MNILKTLLLVGPTASGDLYDMLGVRRGASGREIQKGYRRVALQMHPDKQAPFASLQEEEEATLLFVEIARAYETLSDPLQRLTYDLFFDGRHGPGDDGAFGSAGRKDQQRRHDDNSGDLYPWTYEEAPFDLFGLFRGGSIKVHFKGTDEHGMPPSIVSVPVTLEQLLQGPFALNITYSRALLCDTCGGTGHSSAILPKCPLCMQPSSRLHLFDETGGRCDGCRDVDDAKQGYRAVRQRRSPGKRRGRAAQKWRGFCQLVRTSCATCSGTGRLSDGSCPRCSGQRLVVRDATVEVHVPAGAPDGLEIEQIGHGNAHIFRAMGMLKLVVRVEAHRRFERVGDNLFLSLKCSLMDALVGFSGRRVTALNGERLPVVHGGAALAGFSKSFPGYGLPRFRQGAESFAIGGIVRVVTHGALVVRFSVVLPRRLTEGQRADVARIIGKDGVAVLEVLLRRRSADQNYRLEGSVEEARFCRQSIFDGGYYSWSADWCVPVPEYFTWWRAFGNAKCRPT